jgi:hypothetical protein
VRLITARGAERWMAGLAAPEALRMTFALRITDPAIVRQILR